MPGRICAVLLSLAALLLAQEGIPQCLKDGDSAYLKGDYDAALQAFTRAWDLARETPADNPLRYDILKRLTSVRAAAGEFADADTWLQQAVNWRENMLARKDPPDRKDPLAQREIADDLLISVSLCRHMKDLDRALVILRRVQGLHIAMYTFNSTQVADDFSRAAQLYGEQKKLEEAIDSLTAAIGIRTKLGGPIDPSLVPDLDRLGEYQTVQRAYHEAETAYRHVLVIRETLYGKTNPDLISTVDGLAYALFGQKKYDAAEPVYQRLLALWETSLGKDHPMVAVALDKIAVFEAAQKKYPEVHEALERSTAIRANFHGLGISQQATQAFTEGHANEARALYQRGLVVLDPPNEVYDELRGQFEDILKTLAGPQGRSQAPPPRSSAKKSAPAKKAGKL